MSCFHIVLAVQICVPKITLTRSDFVDVDRDFIGVHLPVVQMTGTGGG